MGCVVLSTAEAELYAGFFAIRMFGIPAFNVLVNSLPARGFDSTVPRGQPDHDQGSHHGAQLRDAIRYPDRKAPDCMDA